MKVIDPEAGFAEILAHAQNRAMDLAELEQLDRTIAELERLEPASQEVAERKLAERDRLLRHAAALRLKLWPGEPDEDPDAVPPALLRIFRSSSRIRRVSIERAGLDARPVVSIVLGRPFDPEEQVEPTPDHAPALAELAREAVGIDVDVRLEEIDA